MTAAASMQTVIELVGIGSVGFCFVLAAFAILAWVAGWVERRHRRRHADRRRARRPGGFPYDEFPRSAP